MPPTVFLFYASILLPSTGTMDPVIISDLSLSRKRVAFTISSNSVSKYTLTIIIYNGPSNCIVISTGAIVKNLASNVN